MEEKITTKILLLLFTIGGILLTVVGVSYAFFTSEQFGLQDNILKTGTVVFKYNERGSGLNLVANEPISDELALSSDEQYSYFDFSVTYNTREQKRIEYDITLLRNVLEDENLTLDTKYVKLSLSEIPLEGAAVSEEKNSLVKYYDELKEHENGSKVVKTDYIEVESVNVTKWYRLRIWLPQEDANGNQVTIFDDIIDEQTGLVLEKGTAEKEVSFKTGVATK